MKIPVHLPNIDSIISSLLAEGKMYPGKVSITDAKGRYLHWDKLRFLPPPEGLTSEQWWAGIKHARRQMYKDIKIKDPDGKPFVFLYTDKIMSTLHWLDQNESGFVGSQQATLNSQMKNTYLTRSLIEESINSSQLEGASTTWVVAKEMLRQNRKPSNKHEQMIYNNYLAMQFIREHKEEKLTPYFLLELQKILTENTLEDKDHAGCFRTKNEDIKVVSHLGDVLHVPPSATHLPDRMNDLCAFFNDSTADTFIHPIVKSIILHFLLGYEHPFIDGNGRTARTLFYWSIAKQNYFLMEYISVSKIIKKAPVKYGMAFLHTEIDENDLTYFIEHQLQIIQQAINDLYEYIEKKKKEIESSEALFLSTKELSDELNYRQLAILKHAIKHPGHSYTIVEHKNSHGIAYDTARLDLSQLSDKFLFLTKEKRGKGFVFRAPKDLAQRIQNEVK
ncbi:MAG: Fic family protein [Pseudomonadota bacterium]